MILVESQSTKFVTLVLCNISQNWNVMSSNIIQILHGCAMKFMSNALLVQDLIVKSFVCLDKVFEFKKIFFSTLRYCYKIFSHI
jgi:hypothetical protein